MFEGNFNHKLNRSIVILATLFSMIGCKDGSSNPSLTLDQNSVSGTSKTDSSNSFSSEHIDGESAIYTYSSSSFDEFKDFVSDFFVMNSTSFVCFNFDSNANIASKFTFEGYPSQVGMTRSDVSTTIFAYYKFSFSFYEERRETIGVDNSRIIEVNEALFINPNDFNSDSLSYLVQEGGQGKMQILFYSNDVLISSPTISFNGQFDKSDVNECCKMLISQITFFKGDH